MQNVLPLQGMRVLVMEDEFLIAMDVEQICLDHGAAEVILLRDVAALGPEIFAESPIHVAILDVMLADRSTVDIAKELAARGVAVVFATGHADHEGLRQAVADAEVVGKPYSVQVLIDAMLVTLGRARAASSGV